jgi:hypothetical protein
MTISLNSQYVLEHPFTKRAVKAFLSGNPKELKFIFDLLQIDVYQETASLCTRAFKSNKKENYPQIEEAIREVSPPERLNTKLPIQIPECIVVTMKTKTGKHRTIIVNPQQLQIDFTKKAAILQAAL